MGSLIFIRRVERILVGIKKPEWRWRSLYKCPCCGVEFETLEEEAYTTRIKHLEIGES